MRHASPRLLALCLALATTVQGTSSPPLSAPALACDEPVHDFGNITDAGPLTHTFVLWNRGTAMLKISNVRACCGGKAKAAETEVPPGTNTTISVELALRGRSGPQDKSVYIASNDARQPYYRLRLTGRVVPQVEVMPPSVSLLDLAPQTMTCSTITVSSQLAGGLPTNAIADVAWLSARIGPRQGSGIPVEVSTLPPLPPGVSQGKVRLLFPDNAVREVGVPVTLSVPQSITAVPTELVLVGGPGASQDVTRYLALNAARAQGFRILRIDCPIPGWTAKAEPTGPGRWRVRLDHLGTGTEGVGNNLSVRIATDHPDCPELHVPVRIVTP